MLKQIKTVLVALLAMVSVAAAASSVNPQTFIQGVTNDLLEKIVKERKNFQKNPEVLYTLVEQNITPYVDFKGISKGVMGQFYRQATEKQRADFEVVFRRSLVRTYGNGLSSYNNQKIVVKPARPGKDERQAQVDMEITTNDGKVYPVTYQLVLNDQGEWKLRNLILNGINLGLTFRNQFASQVEQSRGNLDKAIASWVPDAKEGTTK